MSARTAAIPGQRRKAPFWPTTLRARLILWSVGVMALVLLALGLILRLTVEARLKALVDNELQLRVRSSARLTARLIPSWYRPPQPAAPGAAQAKPPAGQPADWQQAARRNRPSREANPLDRYRARSLDLLGQPLFPGSRDTPWDPKTVTAAANGIETLSTVDNGGDPLRVISAPIMAHRRISAVAQLAYPLSETQRDINGVTYTLLMLVPIALLFVAVSAAFLTSRLLTPVRRVVETASRISAEDLSERLPIAGSDEFAGLVRTLNAMLDRLEGSFEQQRRFIADASHELRTPLTAIKAHTSMALDGEKSPASYRRALEGLDRSATRMGRLVQDLLLLARSDAGQLTPIMRSLPLADAVNAAADMVRADEQAKIIVRIEPTLRVTGDSEHLVRLFTNLIDNALRHTPPDGTVTISAEGEGRISRITVRDTGCGIRAEDVPHLTERFYRVDESRARRHGGTGLGLAICLTIVEAHGGTLTIESEPGVGTTVSVTLPLGADVPALPAPPPSPAAATIAP